VGRRTPLFGESITPPWYSAEQQRQVDAFMADHEFDDLEAGMVGCREAVGVAGDFVSVA